MFDWLIVVFGVIAIVWCFPSVLVLPVISLGSFKHIIFIDKQLAKDLNKYYDDKGYMRPKYQASWDVGSRFINYCIAYPFIRHRETTDSKKFKAFMWWNALGFWSWIIVFFLAILEKGLGIGT
ncbi:hypothetical protein [Vibrio sp. Isolate24]|uniref:hypothetical protein n=1 Tax=Vibrio sp. Isolate24 TaxID=2908534 RepID=UPI001EFE3526|nr:hypothetical protein [Vibrio sp. Isolate24]MCG9676890.1 hypothetical protein [Vibrio sp. Isolate24]